MKVTVTSGNSTRVAINNQQPAIVRSVSLQPQVNYSNTVNNIFPEGATRLVDLSDVDASDVDDNEVVVFDQVANNFVIKPLPVVSGGEF